MKLLTASALTRVRACPASHQLPWYGDENAYAEQGTRKHALIESLFLHGMASTIASMLPTPEELAMLERVRDLIRDRFGDAAISVEQSVAIDLVDGEVRGLGQRRAYGDVHASNEVTGTWDLVISGPERLVVLDWKGPFGYVPPVAVNLQLRMLGYGAAGMRAAEEVEVGYMRLAEDPETFRIESSIMRGPDLVATLDELRRVHRAAQNANAPVVSGEHCRYCPAYRGCPAKIQLIRALATNPAAVVPSAGELTDEEASIALVRWREAAEVLGRIGGELHARAAVKPIHVREGVVFGPRMKSKSEIIGKVAHRVIERLHGREAADLACDFETSKAAIKRALDPLAAPRQKTKLNDAALEAIRLEGGIKKTTYPKYEDYPAGAGAVPALPEGD